MNFTIGQKLGSSLAALISLSVLQAYLSYAAIGTISRTLDLSVEKASRSSSQVEDIQASVAAMKAQAKLTQFAYALNGMLGQKASACVSCHALPEPDQAKREFTAIAAGVRPKLKALGASASLPGEQQLLDGVDQAVTEWTTAFGEFIAQASARQFDAGHSIITDRMEPISERLSKAVREIEAVEARGLKRAQAETVAGVKSRTMWFFGLQFLVLVPLFVFAWRFIRSLTAQLRLFAAVAQRLAAGDAESASKLLGD